MPGDFTTLNPNPFMTKSSNAIASDSKPTTSRKAADSESNSQMRETKSTQIADIQEDWGFLQMRTSNNSQVVMSGW